MKNNIIKTVSTLMLFIPWTLLPLRSFPWALEYPAAEIMIASYAAFMVLSGIFTIYSYRKWNVKGIWMQICTAINGIYAAVGIVVLAQMGTGYF